ncbi:MAG TPA: RND transporter, partial [Bacteroidetes bacterium]|nr:RND transporter [Bacteroidota bacterium]
MWQVISRIILRNRVIFLTAWILLTAFMVFKTLQVQLSYDLNKSIPDKAQANLDYEAFKKEFGDEGNLIVIAVQTDRFFELDFFREWTRLTEAIGEVPNVQNVLSVPQSVRLVR